MFTKSKVLNTVNQLTKNKDKKKKIPNKAFQRTPINGAAEFGRWSDKTCKCPENWVKSMLVRASDIYNTPLKNSKNRQKLPKNG
jgi:hypothetical protein